MHKVVFRLIRWVFILCFLPLGVFGQISAPNADFTDSTDYVNNDLGRHPIYIYYPGENGYPNVASLIAEISDEDSLNFRWIKYNYLTNVFDDTVQFDEVVSQSIYESEGEGGYKVDVFNNNIDTAFYAWNYISSFKIINIDIDFSTCELMKLETLYNLDEEGFLYYDLVDTTELYKVHKEDSISWERVPELDSVDIPEEWNPQFNAPTEYARFILTAIDNFGLEITSYFDIEEAELDDGEVYLKATKADFKASRDGSVIDETTIQDQAPLLVQFENLSENAEGFEWKFYNENSWIAKGVDSVMSTEYTEIPFDSIRYERPGVDGPGMYNVYLKTFGPIYEVNDIEKQCVDTILKEEYIVVDSVSFLTFANVFSPTSGGDGPNDIFHFENYKSEEYRGKSVKNFSIKIYSRWGQKMYEYYGDINEWGGWDGTNLIGLYAKTGVYYYSAFIEGYDQKFYHEDKDEKVSSRCKGYIHLFRND